MGFIEDIKDYAIKDYKTSKVLPSITIAQAILESGWGKSQLTLYANNLFGIKGDYKGQYITMKTQEYINGQWITVNANFRKYPSYLESIKDHSELLNKSWYSLVIQAKDYKAQAKALQKCGYATDPNYANLLIQIIEENKLYQYDVSRETNKVVSKLKSYSEIGQATVLVDVLNVRNYPSTKDVITARYTKGEKINYDSVYINDGYYWISYINYQGQRRYVASRTTDSKDIYLKCV